ncbi:hypothetical protein AMATHDRAFT_52223 [Amanita thiersii Skay4041]|uniref:DUF6697 domain-containing protein n=1 Tax=Amanita thiersii Skay4041 TaxID=703135 RepID=A0A2A9NWP0_9AGAR|nr:hypothetical protein AMATHDRAFT_52223 [Amanita thiersii Skay4041]
MDHDSWSFLVKRWSEDYENYQRLQHELAVSKEECERLRGEVRTLQQKTEQQECSNPVIPQTSVKDVHDHSQRELYGAEAGIEKARSEYTKLRDLLQASTAQIESLRTENKALREALNSQEGQAQDQRVTNKPDDTQSTVAATQALKVENAGLCEERDKLLQQCNQHLTKLHSFQISVTAAHAENTRLHKQIQEATGQIQQLQDEMEKITAMTTKFEDIKLGYKRRIDSQCQEAQQLKHLIDVRSAENKELQDKVANLKDSLSKSREHNKSLTSMVANLQDIMQHKSAGVCFDSPSNKTLKKDGMEQCKPTIPDQLPQLPGSLVSTSNKQPQLTPMPRERHEAFANSPQVIPEISGDLETSKFLFERSFLTSTIGGNRQSLIVRVVNSQTTLAKSKQISTYLCPSLDHNPWCPTTPGQHGYMFVGLGREKDTFLEPQNYHVFVGLLKDVSYKRRQYSYVGVYRAVRVQPLTVDEWNTLSESVKTTYVSRTKEKVNHNGSLAQMRTAYDGGELAVPCVKLECIDFDNTLFTSLVQLNSNSAEMSGQSPLSGKRRRVSLEDSANGSQRKSRTRKSFIELS